MATVTPGEPSFPAAHASSALISRMFHWNPSAPRSRDRPGSRPRARSRPRPPPPGLELEHLVRLHAGHAAQPPHLRRGRVAQPADDREAHPRVRVGHRAAQRRDLGREAGGNAVALEDHHVLPVPLGEGVGGRAGRGSRGGTRHVRAASQGTRDQQCRQQCVPLHGAAPSGWDENVGGAPTRAVFGSRTISPGRERLSGCADRPRGRGALFARDG